ncbi:PC-esterase domain-containing protein 1A-like isoform X4 [Rhinoderma darwinii]|uniref:PC-esterase domain-containing protein 1A-like isoform X4 n=1 Tax=Rhinoderma darwinii TaxID=43563 RepID=UPI003F672791
MGCFRSADVRQLLHNKFVLVLGDSIQRSVYKDLVKLLQDDKYLSEAQLKRKGEMTFANDSLVEGGTLNEMHNGTTYREVRQYRTGHHLVRFYFLTRAYSTYLESILSDVQSGPQPDILIANSCVWDLMRYDDKHLETYKTNLDRLFQRLKEVLSPQCLILWNMTMPVGYRDNEIPQYTAHNLRPNIVEGNFFSATLADLHKLDVLDLHYHFRCNLRLRCRDAVHWNQLAHRMYTQILLSHVAQAWGVEAPKGQMVEDASPFVNDSPVLTANVPPGYFSPSGPAFTNHPFFRRNFLFPNVPQPFNFNPFPHHVPHPQEAWKIPTRRAQKPRDGRINPYARPPMFLPGIY